MKRLDQHTRTVLSKPVLAKVRELTGEAEAPSTNPATGLQEFTTMPTEEDKAWSRRMSQWWPMRLFGMFKPSPTEPVPDPQQGPSLLPKPLPPGKGLLTPTVQSHAVAGDSATPDGEAKEKSSPIWPPPWPQRHPKSLGIKIVSPAPTCGTERNDPAGSGEFWASRLNPDGSRRKHSGLDITVERPGDPVVSPIDGIVKRRGLVYKNDEDNPRPN